MNPNDMIPYDQWREEFIQWLSSYGLSLEDIKPKQLGFADWYTTTYLIGNFHLGNE
jgi:hypothetical protein